MDGFSAPGEPVPAAAALPWIDWVRFLAAFEVFLFHLHPYVFGPTYQIAPDQKNLAVTLWVVATHFGSEAVLVFFALSGYLVGGGLIDRVRADTFDLAAFAIDRATRLMLPFVPALAISVGLQLLRHEPVDGVRTLGNLVSLQGVLVHVDPYLGVDWSLAYESWFYVLGGALAAFFAMPERRTRGRALALALVAVSFLVFAVIKLPHLLFCLLLGALFAQFPLRRARWTAIGAGAMLAGVGVVLSNAVFGTLRVERLHLATVNGALCDLLICVGALIILRNLVAMPARTARARRVDRIGTRLAAFSYSLYLIHIPVLTVLARTFPAGQGITPRGLTQYLAYLVVVPLVAYGFYWLFERHTDRVRRALKRRLGVGQAALVA